MKLELRLKLRSRQQCKDAGTGVLTDGNKNSNQTEQIINPRSIVHKIVHKYTIILSQQIQYCHSVLVEHNPSNQNILYKHNYSQKTSRKRKRLI